MHVAVTTTMLENNNNKQWSADRENDLSLSILDVRLWQAFINFVSINDTITIPILQHSKNMHLKYLNLEHKQTFCRFWIIKHKCNVLA